MKKYFISLFFVLTTFISAQQKPIIKELNENAIKQIFTKEEDINRFTNIINNPHYEKNFPLYADIKKESLEKLLINKPTNDLSLLTWVSQSSLEEENYKSTFIDTNINYLEVLKIEDNDTTKYDITSTLLYYNSEKDLDTNTAIFRGDIVEKGALADWTATSIGILKYYEKNDTMNFSIKSYTRKNNAISTVLGWFNIGCDREPVADSTLAKIQKDVNRATKYIISEEIRKKANYDLEKNNLSEENHEILMNIICEEKYLNSF